MQAKATSRMLLLHLYMGTHNRPLPVPQLEEGEVDSERARTYAYCYKKAYRKEQDANMTRLRTEAAERRAMLSQKNTNHPVVT